MLFIVRGKNREHDRSLRIHAETAEEAEAIGWKRGLFVTEVTAVESTSRITGKLDRVAEVVRRAWTEPAAAPTSALQAFGRAITHGQVAALMLCGIATWVIDLRTLVFH